MLDWIASWIAEAKKRGVADAFGNFSYHPNLLVHQITHWNGVVETWANDPNSMRRPGSISATGPAAAWSSGAYVYDGTGNITKIGPAWFTYDKVNRLAAGNIYTAPMGGGTATQQGYTYDPFGNLTAITGDRGRNTLTSTATNRLVGATYDAAGNLTDWTGTKYQYDGFNQMVRMTTPGGEDWAYVYTADDERIWSYNLLPTVNTSYWTLRDLSGQVLREYVNEAGTWTVGTDYIRRESQLLAAETRLGRRHFHLDHLGTPRLITNSVGYKTAYHVYYPFGEEATAFDQDGERMKFTGHERDLASGAGAGDDLDYMHARHYSPVTGRFLSVDPSQESPDPDNPQSWNRYSYALGSPLKYIDPDGLKYVCPPEGCPAPPTTFWGKLLQDLDEASILPGPSAMAVAPRTAGVLLPRLTQFFSRVFGGSDDAARAASIASRFAAIEGRAAVLQKVVRSDGSLNLSATVEKQLLGVAIGKDRRFIPVQSILDTIGSGTRVPGPQKVAGQFLYAAKALYKGKRGILEVVVNEKTGKIVHVLFRSAK